MIVLNCVRPKFVGNTHFNGIQAPRCNTKPLRKITTPTANRMDVVKNMTVTALESATTENLNGSFASDSQYFSGIVEEDHPFV